jgi:REP element-mobilizing transposase RayT
MRKPRKQKSNAVYHITVQTNRGEKEFFNYDTQNLYREILEKALKKFDFAVLSCEFTENWVDLYIRTGKNVSISAIMHWIQFVFAQKWNRKNNAFGSFWRDRFFSEIVEYTGQIQEWMEKVFIKIKSKLFCGKVKIWTIKEMIPNSISTG